MHPLLNTTSGAMTQLISIQINEVNKIPYFYRGTSCYVCNTTFGWVI